MSKEIQSTSIVGLKKKKKKITGPMSFLLQQRRGEEVVFIYELIHSELSAGGLGLCGSIDSDTLIATYSFLSW